MKMLLICPFLILVGIIGYRVMDRIDRFLEKRDENCACMGQQPEGAVSVVSEDPVVIAVSRETLEQISEMGDGTELVIHAASKHPCRTLTPP